ncbi:uncharacterized protein L203_102834 [Cryptococcus depauperatus CBS 7841]|uniref:SURF1-like protein n=1 Tax=Cryptococcus depauperatus CBS 7841 TaxID=1295531 RepID=A0A1E3IAX8_9TREE|nr:mitochondrial protein required for respiration [Cryptococcus depauperatus CBS 7841]
MFTATFRTLKLIRYDHSIRLSNSLSLQSRSLPHLAKSPSSHPFSSSSLDHSTYTGKTKYTGTKPKSQLLRPTTILLIFVPILTGYLGYWQLQRLKWKLALIEEVDRNMAKAPMLLPNHINLAALPDFNFRRVLVKGQFTGPPILLGPQTLEGFVGYHLILPFVRSEGSTILVNRGFITTTRANDIRAGKQVPSGLAHDGGTTGEDIIVEGLLPKTGERTIWSPENDIQTNEWFWKDVEQMAEVAGGQKKGVQPVLVDAIADQEQVPTLLMQQGIPVGRPPHIELRNQHAEYAAIWLSLSASTTAMLIYVLTKSRVMPKQRRPRLY